MKKIFYIISLTLLAFVTSCSEDVSEPFDGSTTLDEIIDYSTFKAEVSDTYIEKEISTRASLSNHIGYANKSYPALNVVFDEKNVAYEYNNVVSYYSPVSGEAGGNKAKYMYSSELRSDGAIVAALWPTESISSTAIKLRNMKSRIAISYEYECDDATDVEAVAIGDLATEGEFVCGATLQYKAKEGSAVASVAASQVATAIEEKDNCKIGTYEAFVIPQTIDQYADYVTFTIDGVENKYYFKSPFLVEPHTLYKMIFEVKKVDNAVDIEITSQESIPDYDQGGDHTIAVNPFQPVVDRWDGVSFAESFAFGDGSSNNPYQINKASELALLMKNEVSYLSKCYKLMINIDWDNRVWEPLAPNYDKEFTGTFDGNGKVIKNMSIPYKYNAGAFIARLGNQAASTISPKVYGTVRNLSLKANVTFDDSEGQKGENFGGIVGMVNGGSRVENCQFSGSVEGSYKVGGIAGLCDGVIVGCTVSNSTVTATSTSTATATKASAGAIAGRVGNATVTPGAMIQYCLSNSNCVSGDKDHTAGIVGGPATAYPNVAKCYVMGLSTNNVDGIFGIAGHEQVNNAISVDNWVITSFCNSDIAIQDNSRSFAFTTSGDMATKLNNAQKVPAPQTIEPNWVWIANPAGEDLAPIPSSSIDE